MVNRKEKYIDKKTNVFLLLFICLNLLCGIVSCGKGGFESNKEYGHLSDSVAKYGVVDSARAMHIIADAEAHGVSWDTIHLTRSKVYWLNNDPRKQEYELQLIADSSEASRTSKYYIDILVCLTKVQALLGHSEEAMRYSLYGDSLAFESNNQVARAHFRFSMGMSALRNDSERGIYYMEQAIQMFDHSKDSVARFEVVRNAMYLMNAYVMQHDYNKCIKLGERVAEDIRFASPEVMAYIDPTKTTRCSTFGLLCMSYGSVGRMQEAGVAYATALDYDNDHPNTPLLYAFCLKTLGRYDEALNIYRQQCSKFEERKDTINTFYVSVLEGLLLCSREVGATNVAYAYAKRVINLRQKLYLEDNKNEFSEWETKYRNQCKEIELVDLKAWGKIKFVILGLMFVAVVAGIVILVIMFRKGRVVNYKNKILATKINELIDIRKGVDRMLNEADAAEQILAEAAAAEKTRKAEAAAEEKAEKKKPVAVMPGSKEVTEAMRANVQKFVSELRKRRPYIESEFNRDEFIAELGLNRRSFAREFERVMGMTIIRYISEQRVLYAAERIREYPNYTIEGIAMDSGFSSRASFYRLFSEYFGISPTEYRMQLNNAANVDTEAS